MAGLGLLSCCPGWSETQDQRLTNFARADRDFRRYDKHQGCFDALLSTEIRIYFRCDLKRQAPYILRFEQLASKEIGKAPSFYFLPQEAKYGEDGLLRFDKANQSTNSYVSDRIKAEDWESTLAIDLHFSSNSLAVSRESIQIYCPPGGVGFLRLLLEPEKLMTDYDRVLELTRKLVSKLDYLSGYVGLGMNVFPGVHQVVTRKAHTLLERYHCVDMTDPYSETRQEDFGLMNVAWLTLLGDERRNELRDETPEGDDVRVLRMGTGIAFQVGPAPIAGIVKREDLSAYRTACRMLRPAKLTGRDIHPWDGLGTTETTAKWVDRFL
jgi:hypothetical protein